MTCPRSCSSRNTLVRNALRFSLLALLSSCSIFSPSSEAPQEVSKGQAVSPTRTKARGKAIVSKFEWAVQSYEGGDYVRAIKQFKDLEKSGPSVPDFDLVPFYLGMSYFNLGRNGDAMGQLERFLQLGTQRRESQDARMALFLTYERQKEWNKLLGLAAETDRLTLFQNNRALLKLLWARALIESNEVMGAKGQLKDSTQYLDLAAGEDRGALSESERDVWGRYHFTSLLIREKECSALGPKTTGSGKKAKVLYANWLEGNVDCLRDAIEEATQEVFLRESAWSGQSASALSRNVENMAAKIRGYLQAESKALNTRRALERSAREQLYRLVSELEKNIKIFKNRSLNPAPLEQIRKRIDLLLVSLSNPS